jgi:2-C-methyl-D-erythritol 2,4-cyclodiphosphate synthase
MAYRTGIGFEVHQLAEGRKLILGGVDIPWKKGVLGHSDGDAVTHAICDALLGAASMGDIGQHFPSSDSNFEGISSLRILEDIAAKLHANGYSIENIDCTIILQEPKLAGYLETMKTNLAEVSGIDVSCISVKATTTDHLGYAGRGEGIAAMSTALISR